MTDDKKYDAATPVNRTTTNVDDVDRMNDVNMEAEDGIQHGDRVRREDDGAHFHQALPDPLPVERVLAHQERSQLGDGGGDRVGAQVSRAAGHALYAVFGRDPDHDVAEPQDQAFRDDRLQTRLDDLDGDRPDLHPGANITFRR